MAIKNKLYTHEKDYTARLFMAGYCEPLAQPAPPARLKYFGFAIVDCGLDDPNDSPVLSNYISEVDTFSNIAQMCVEQHTDTMISRINLMNSKCVKPILSVSKVFIYYKDTNGPSGSNYMKLRAGEFATGIYYYTVSGSRGVINAGKFVRE